MNKKLDLILVCGSFDYGLSVSGNYILYRILKKIPNLNFKVMYWHGNTLPESRHNFDPSDFLCEHDVLNNLPEHKILLTCGNDLSKQQFLDIYKKHQSKHLLTLMTHWPYSNTLEGDFSAYPELDGDNYLTGDLVKERLDLYKQIDTSIICHSSYSQRVHNISGLRELPSHVIPLPFDEIDTLESTHLKSQHKTILWGTTQPQQFRKGKSLFEQILRILYKKCSNPNEIKIKTVGPPLEINTDFEVEYKGQIENRAVLSPIYRDSSVFALTTLADAGPMMATESLKNETPLVAFDAGVQSDMVDDGKNGYIINLRYGWENLTHNGERYRSLQINNSDIESFADKLYEILYNKNYHMDLDYVKEFNSEEVVTKACADLFKSIK